jgi:hypothetical protein
LARVILSHEHGGPLISIMLLAHEHEPDPAMRPKPVAPDTCEEILSMMIAGLTNIDRSCEPHRRSGARAAALRREGRKIARNELCVAVASNTSAAAAPMHRPSIDHQPARGIQNFWIAAGRNTGHHQG